jgi:hypothetical protein
MAPWDLFHVSAVKDRLHAAWCNIQNVIMLFGTLTTQTVGKCVQCYGEKICVVRLLRRRSCGSVWTTEI